MSESNAPEPGALAPNVHEFTVSELSGAVKRTIEDAFGYVRVRGELGRVSRPNSGHVYLDLKDDRAVLSGVIWRGTAQRLKIRPEQGMEVVATGRLTTYAGQSRYQIIIESIEPAGLGALMALLEERRKKLTAEGLFATERKKPLPFLPEVIGVVTSPTGAVIRDILHRLEDRFPRHVLVWPVMVQGAGAAEQIAEAVKGFNAIAAGGKVPRPDVLIVARGGGSIEDLWAFNEEAPVRAVAASGIPVIAAVGHETDTTLIDYAADKRAPTPTAAAEMAVPVRAELIADMLDRERRLVRCMMRAMEERRARLESLRRGLPRAADLLAYAEQRLDAASGRLRTALPLSLQGPAQRLGRASAGLSPSGLRALVRQGGDRVGGLGDRMARAQRQRLERAADRLEGTGKLLASLGYQQTLKRGYALVQRPDGSLVRAAAETQAGDEVSLRFHDGEAPAVIGEAGGGRARGSGPARPAKRKSGGGKGKSARANSGQPDSGKPKDKQGTLF
ncbi:MAG: exodeoxyribonuclease VII large subunit [Alphaproteobacteria bacterium]